MSWEVGEDRARWHLEPCAQCSEGGVGQEQEHGEFRLIGIIFWFRSHGTHSPRLCWDPKTMEMSHSIAWDQTI